MENGIRVDKQGNQIGNGGFQADYFTFEIANTTIDVNFAETTESVYLTYTNEITGKSCKVRFSNHQCNAVKFGDILDGYNCTPNEVMYRLGMIERTFIPSTYLSIGNRQVAKKDLHRFEMSDLTIQEMYAMGEGADLSAYYGKIAKDSNYLIQDKEVRLLEKTTLDCFGNSVRLGNYIYSN